MSWIFSLRIATTLLLLLVCVLLFSNRKKLGKNIPYFLAAMYFVLIPNLVSFILDLLKYDLNTTILFVIFVNILGFLFFFIYFYKIQKMPAVRKLQEGLIGLFILTIIGLILIYKGAFFTQFPMFFYFFQTFLLLIFIALFFFDTFNSDLILDIKKYFPFWVSLSLIIIYVGLIPIMLFIHQVNVEVNRNIYFLILYLINIIGYSIMVYGILVSDLKSGKYVENGKGY